MKIGFALMPYKNEDLYSWVVRYVKHNVKKSDYNTIEELFGTVKFMIPNIRLINSDL